MAKVEPSARLIVLWAERKKCAMCKHREKEGHILPAKEFKPSPAWLFHYYDTHGLDAEIVADWLWTSVYGVLHEKWGFLLDSKQPANVKVKIND
jgi:hypothetical protein